MTLLEDLEPVSTESVCSELDDLAVRMLEKMKEFMDCKVMIEDYMKTGSLHLAKSRYIMGNKSVSALQLPSEDGNEITAQARIIQSEENEKDDLPLFQLSRLSLDEKADGLKHRKGNDNEAEGAEEIKEKGRTVSVDPIKWFGYLVPQNLRYAQNNFNSALEVVVQCANLQVEVGQIHGKYRNLLEKKKQLSKAQ